MCPQQVTVSYDLLNLPPQFSTHITPLHSPKQGSSNMNISQLVPSTQSQQTILRTPLYTPAQTANIQPSTFTIDTIHSNPQNHPTFSRTLSRPQLPLIANYPLLFLKDKYK